MANVKITEMPNATLPLAGTEPLEVVQGGQSRQAPASAFGGGGDVVVLATDFNTNFKAANDTATSVLLEYTIPAGTLIGVRLLEVESWYKYTNVLFVGGTTPRWELTSRVDSTELFDQVMPANAPTDTFWFGGGYLRLNLRFQAFNAPDAQRNTFVLDEMLLYQTVGAFALTRPIQFNSGQLSLNESAFDMTGDRVLQIRAKGNQGAGTSLLTHHYTRMMRYGA